MVGVVAHIACQDFVGLGCLYDRVTGPLDFYPAEAILVGRAALLIEQSEHLVHIDLPAEFVLIELAVFNSIAEANSVQV